MTSSRSRGNRPQDRGCQGRPLHTRRTCGSCRSRLGEDGAGGESSCSHPRSGAAGEGGGEHRDLAARLGSGQGNHDLAGRSRSRDTWTDPRSNRGNPDLGNCGSQAWRGGLRCQVHRSSLGRTALLPRWASVLPAHFRRQSSLLHLPLVPEKEPCMNIGHKPSVFGEHQGCCCLCCRCCCRDPNVPTQSQLFERKRSAAFFLAKVRCPLSE